MEGVAPRRKIRSLDVPQICVVPALLGAAMTLQALNSAPADAGAGGTHLAVDNCRFIGWRG
ncbi:hypothetical protein [Nonomuraea sp. B19D2]|uniref:hypothetical protein n=1 Tax=Nonomuraea sp. B19D2 TaxID=3159561 RepID=UPI0032DA2791